MINKNNAYSYGLIAAGIIFIGIGMTSFIYVNIPVKVNLDGALESGKTDTITPNMDKGNILNIYVSGSQFDISITGPEKNDIISINSISNFNYTFKANNTGQHIIKINNIGNSTVFIKGDAYTKGNQAFYIGNIMLIITGIVISGLGIRTMKKY